MPDHSTAHRLSRTAAPGVTERHTRACAGTLTKAGRVKGCTCSPTFRAAVSIGGRDERRRLSGTFSTLGDAVGWIEDTKRADRNGDAPPAPEPVAPSVPTIREAADTFTERMHSGAVLAKGGKPYSAATIENYAGALTRDVLPFVVESHGIPLGDLTADVVDTRMIGTMADSLAARGRKAAKARARKAREQGRTVRESTGTGGARLAVAALRQLLADLYRRGVIDTVPPPPPTMPEPPKPRERRLDHAETAALVGAAYADDQRLDRSLLGPYVLMASRVGARRGELRRLVWGPDGLDLSGEVATVTIARNTTKTDAGKRTVAIDADTARAMKAHRKATGNARAGRPVFPDPQDVTRPMGPDLIRAGFERIGKVAGVESPGTHLMRHTVTSWAVESGADVAQVAARMGHAQVATTLGHYVHADRERIAAEPLDLPFPDVEGI